MTALLCAKLSWRLDGAASHASHGAPFFTRVRARTAGKLAPQKQLCDILVEQRSPYAGGSGGEEMQLQLPFWQRLLLTIAAMLVASGIAGLLWRSIFNFSLPSYAAGIVGGLAALPCWELLKRFRPSQDASR